MTTIIIEVHAEVFIIKRPGNLKAEIVRQPGAYELTLERSWVDDKQRPNVQTPFRLLINPNALNENQAG